jgi:hypothetical protein
MRFRRVQRSHTEIAQSMTWPTDRRPISNAGNAARVTA